MDDSTELEAAQWSPGARVCFRFAFVYLLLYNIEPFVGLLPWAGEKIATWLYWPVAKLAAWVGVHFFHLTGVAATRHDTGSGDTAQDYLVSGCFLVISLVAAAIWSAIDERSGGRREYQTAYAWLRLVVRYVLAATLLGYGFVKFFPGQFSSPGLFRLTESYGDSTPMGLLWTFMGASKPYEVFAGVAEIVPGILLLFRRTTALGAAMAAGVLLNVVMLNLCYDVPVKLYSGHLVAMALFLLLPHFMPMFRFFVLRQPAAVGGVWLPRWERRPLRIASCVLQAVVIAGLVWGAVGAYHRRDQPVAKTVLYGVWAVREDSVGPRWGRLTVDKYMLRVWDYQGFGDAYQLTDQQPDHAIVFKEPDKVSTLRWQEEKTGLRLEGSFAGKPVLLHLQRVGKQEFTLLSRGFHWVSEFPNNR